MHAISNIASALLTWTLLLSSGQLTAQDFTQPFKPDPNTVVLYHFDEGQGDETRDACGDPELTLRAHQEALWGSRAGFGATARFLRREDDANVLVGPVYNPKLELRGCTREWTIEAWVRHTGGSEQNGYRNICGSDDEGVGLTDGIRGGWNFFLIAPRIDRAWVLDRGIGPHARFFGSYTRAPGHDVNQIGRSNSTFLITDDEWHHVAWQFRYQDQMHFLFLDGKLIYRESRPGGRSVINDAARCDLPFVVGGFLHSQEAPSHFDPAGRMPFPNYGNFEGEIDELRISDIMRYPVAQQLRLIHRDLPEAGLKLPYSATLSTDSARGKVRWELAGGKLPSGLVLDRASGLIQGTPIELASEARLTIRASDEIGHSDQHLFTLSVRPGHITTESLPLALTGHSYRHRLESEYMREPVRWRIRRGTLPEGLGLDRASGVLSGTPTSVIRTPLTVEAVDGLGAVDTQELIFRVVAEALRQIAPDKHTVALWNWQGPGSRRVADLRGDEELALTWINLKGETRIPRPNWGGIHTSSAAAEGGFVGPQNNQKLDLRTCTTAWTVEAWVRPGGPVDGYGRKVDFGHICGTYDNSGLGVWELYLSNHNSPNGSFSPGVHFLGAEPEQSLKDLHPWSRPEGIAADPKEVGIQDTRWHHVAWQYSYLEDLHQLFLDGRLIWQMKSPDGRSLVNNRRHNAQFSVGTRLTGYARLGGNFNWLGKGNFFGQIGEIRISDVRRYGGEAED